MKSTYESLTYIFLGLACKLWQHLKYTEGTTLNYYKTQKAEIKNKGITTPLWMVTLERERGGERESAVKKINQNKY